MERFGANFESPEKVPNEPEAKEGARQEEDLAAELQAAVGNEGEYHREERAEKDPDMLLTAEVIKGIFMARGIFDDKNQIAWIEKYGNSLRLILESDRDFLEDVARNPFARSDELERRLNEKLS